MAVKRKRRWLRRLLGLALVAALGALALELWHERRARERPLADLAAETESARREDSLSRQVIPPTDLPPQGTRSLFDHVIKQAGALPYPFDGLLDLLASYDRDGRRPVALLIPDGRSLLKAQATFHGPRIVVAADARPVPSETDLGTRLSARLFLGFVEAAAEIEVISYNEEAGRFEFQVVRDYREGGVPTIGYARRALCTTCHQADAPIFPERPWQETNARREIAEKILDARAVAGGERPWARYLGVPIVTPFATAEAFDDLVQTAGALTIEQSLWIDGCGGDAKSGTECRGQMLGLAIQYLWNPQSIPAGGAAAGPTGALALLQQQAWPRAGIAVPSASLPNRDPLRDSSSKPGTLRRLRAAFRERDAGQDAALPKSVGAFEKAPRPKPELDPLTPRPPRRTLDATTLEGVFGAAELLGANEARLLEKQAEGDPARLDRALSSAPVGALLAARPLRPSAVVRALSAELGAAHPPRSCCESDEGMSPPVLAGVKPLWIDYGSPLEPFERYCFACHRGNPAARLDFMNGDDEKAVLERIKQVAKIREVLDFERYSGTSKEGTLMPPKGSYQRRDLDRARAEGKDDLRKMLREIPAEKPF